MMGKEKKKSDIFGGVVRSIILLFFIGVALGFGYSTADVYAVKRDVEIKQTGHDKDTRNIIEDYIEGHDWYGFNAFAESRHISIEQKDYADMAALITLCMNYSEIYEWTMTALESEDVYDLYSVAGYLSSRLDRFLENLNPEIYVNEYSDPEKTKAYIEMVSEDFWRMLTSFCDLKDGDKEKLINSQFADRKALFAERLAVRYE